MRTTSAYHLPPNAIQIEIKPTFSPKTVPLPICERTKNEHTESQFADPLPCPHTVPLIKGNRHIHAVANFLFSFFQFSLEAQTPQSLSCRARRTLPLLVKGGGRKGDTLMSHWSLLYKTQDLSCKVAHQSPPVEGGTSLHHHSRPHASSLGTMRSSNLREMVCAPTAEHQWLVRRGLGIDSHTGRRVRGGHLKGPGPNQT